MIDTTNDIPRKRPGILDELLPDGSMVLYRPDPREIITLNRVAAYVWECCDGRQNTASIIAAVREIFPEAPDIAHDVSEVLRDFRERALIEVTPA
jgi:hypothetical protein